LGRKLTQADQPQLDPEFAATMQKLGFDPQQICTGDIGTLMEQASPNVKEEEFGNLRAALVTALYQVGRGEELQDWAMNL